MLLVLLSGASAAQPDGARDVARDRAGRTSQVVLIDDSLSMGYSAGDSTAFARAKEAAAGSLCLDPAAGPLHDRDDVGPARAGRCTKWKGRAATSC